MTHFNEAIEYFRKEFGKEDFVLKVPCRVNIIGEHIDYCGATVLSFASEPVMHFIVSKSEEKTCRIFAYDRTETELISHETTRAANSWAGYLIRILKQLKQNYGLEAGANILFTSNIPVGAGMSSSSALCCGFASAMNELYDLGISVKDIVKLGSIAEHEQGLIGGLMDQYTIVNGLKGHALYLDCGNLRHRAVPLDLDRSRIILINSHVKHELVDSEYNDRRAQLNRALAELNALSSDKKKILELDISDLDVLDKGMSKKRLRHVITEIERVHKAKEAVENKDLQLLGKLMTASHNSLMSDYEVSCEEIDFLVRHLMKKENILGARIMGGGFGGCVICLVGEAFDPQVLETIFMQYREHYNLQAQLIEVLPVDGIGKVNADYS